MNRITTCYIEIMKNALTLHTTEILAKYYAPHLRNGQAAGRLMFTSRAGETLGDELETVRYLLNRIPYCRDGVLIQAPNFMEAVDKLLEDIRGIKVEVIE